MKRKNVIKGAIAFAVVGLIGATFISANASVNQRSDWMRKANFGQNLTAEQIAEKEGWRSDRQAEMLGMHEEMQTAIESGNYDTWKEAVGDNHPFADQITEENFPRFLEAHNLMQEGRDIMEELGIEHHGKGMFQGRHGGGMMRWNK